MTKGDIKAQVLECIEKRKPCYFNMKYETKSYLYYPLLMNDRFFLGAVENDFELDGYTIRRFRDVTAVKIRDSLCNLIDIQEGLIDQIVIPALDLTSWESIFHSLKKMAINIIIEDERDPDDREYADAGFYIGHIEKVCRSHLWFRHFNADGIWQDEAYKIMYSEVTSVSFHTRYIDVFSKYLPPLPENIKG
ncbi:hypothetical protein H8699_07065 [Christensenellaceae bacterium NSJ-44]|uniref:Uncharacterized protein n=1 Tax=Luoshenia tenuis TaxID=2763654 RepID=A0A926D2L3_9FIRM|nr:hypothetical protein [Luoshenia tenuis]MBC8529185.1 hypothetical protein [Luoshenia tenuis]